jgi:hypothetical protein
MDRQDEARLRRSRNIALAIALGAVVLLFFVMSIVQWSAHPAH